MVCIFKIKINKSYKNRVVLNITLFKKLPLSVEDIIILLSYLPRLQSLGVTYTVMKYCIFVTY